jgi:hypothetical protein
VQPKGGVVVRTKERVVYFYDLLIESYTGADGIKNAASADLRDLLARILQSRPIGHAIASRGTVRVDVADWKFAAGQGTHRVLINRADKTLSDVAFRDFDSRKVRKGGKTKAEGIEASCHVIMRPNKDGRSALVLLTAGAGVTRETVERLIAQRVRQLAKSEANDDLFAFRHPSGEKAANGAPATYRVRYKVECVAHKSKQLDEALKHGGFVSLDLIAPEYDKFDAGGNLRINASSISIKADNPTLVTAAGLVNAVKSYLKKTPKNAYDSARIRYKADGNNTSTVTLNTNDLDSAFSRKERVELSTEAEAQQEKLEPIVIAAMESLL